MENQIDTTWIMGTVEDLRHVGPLFFERTHAKKRSIRSMQVGCPDSHWH